MIIDLGPGEGSDLASVTQDSDPLGDFDNFFQTVAHKDDCDPMFLQSSYRCQQETDLVPGQ